VVERKKPRKTYSEAAVTAEKPREAGTDKFDWNWDVEREAAARSIAQAAEERRAAEKAAAEKKQREYRPEDVVPPSYKNAAAASPGTLANLMDQAGMLDESSSEDEDVVMDTRVEDEILDNSDVDS
jgi:hypothetical protein